MVVGKCVEKYRDSKGRIIGYKIQNQQNNKFMEFNPQDLKAAITSGRINILNLRLTSDGRLLDKQQTTKLAGQSISKLSRREMHEYIEKLGREILIKFGCAEDCVDIYFGEDHSNGENIIFEPFMTYHGIDVMLSIQYNIETNIFCISFYVEDINYIEKMKCAFTPDNGRKLVQRFISKTKPNIITHTY